MQFPPLPFVFRNGLADAAKLGMTHYQIWDKIIAAAKGRGLIPQTEAGRWSATTMLSVAGAFVDWNLSQDTAWTKVLHEVATDAASELGSRISGLRSPAPNPARTDAPAADAAAGIEALWTMEPAFRSALLASWTSMDTDRQKRFRAQLISMTARELVVVAQMSPQERTAFLELLFPEPGPSILDDVRGGIREITQRLDRFSGRSGARR